MILSLAIANDWPLYGIYDNRDMHGGRRFAMDYWQHIELPEHIRKHVDWYGVAMEQFGDTITFEYGPNEIYVFQRPA